MLDIFINNFTLCVCGTWAQIFYKVRTLLAYHTSHLSRLFTVRAVRATKKTENTSRFGDIKIEFNVIALHISDANECGNDNEIEM